MFTKDTVFVCIAKGGDMKIRAVFLTLLSGALLALAIIAIPFQSVAAKTCYNSKTKAIIPCPSKQAKPTATDAPPTRTPTPSATSVPTSTNTAQPIFAPIIAAPIAGNTGQTNPTPGPSDPNPISFWLWLVGGVLLGAALIGMLLPAILKQFRGDKSAIRITSRDVPAYAEGVVEDYQYPELHSPSHNKLDEEITDRPEHHTIQ